MRTVSETVSVFEDVGSTGSWAPTLGYPSPDTEDKKAEDVGSTGNSDTEDKKAEDVGSTHPGLPTHHPDTEDKKTAE